jgi:large subunit ribosomal protein L35
VAVQNACGTGSSPRLHFNNKATALLHDRHAGPAMGRFFNEAQPGHRRSSKMPKMKTKSSAKKRFKITATGKVKAAAAGKRHGMIKRSNKFIRDARGTMVLAKPDGVKVIKNYLPNGL